MAAPDIEELARRLKRMEDHASILALEASYGPTWDSGDAEGYAQLYTPDGALEVLANAGRPAAVYAGREQLRAFCEEVYRNGAGLHLLSDLQITALDDDTASARAYQQVFLDREADGASRQVHTVSHLRISYRYDEGAWRISRRVARPIRRSETVFSPMTP